MPSAVLDPMSKKQKPPATDSAEHPKNPVTTKVDKELIRKAKTVASHREIDLFDYLDSVLTPAVEKDYYAIIREEGKK